MRFHPGLTGFLIFLGVLLLIDVYVFSAVKTMTTGLEARVRKYIHWTYWLVNISLFAWFIFLAIQVSAERAPTRAFGTFFGVFLMFFIPKLVIFIVIGAEDVVRGFRALYALGYNNIASDKISVGIDRRQFLSRTAGAIALVPLLGVAHGMIVGKFRFRVRRETLYFDDLPEAFDGFTITQLSDIHSGSFDPDTDREEVRAGIQLAQSQNSDLFVFTGDLVNNIADEMLPWKTEFSALRAPMGQFSILGNHDYGDYYYGHDPSPEKTDNFNRLCATHGEIGFDLVRDGFRVLEKDGQKIYLLGVENWGSGGFTKYGDLDRALKNVPEDAFKILLSHDPSHFDEKVSTHKTHVHLTLAGHTHGAQFGVEIPWLKWSPIQMKYPHWAGMYTVANRNLYVNRGFGFLGFPGRVGIWPEVTVLTLKKKLA